MGKPNLKVDTIKKLDKNIKDSDLKDIKLTKSIISKLKDKIHGDDKVRIILMSMIKNESKVIERCYESLIDFVDAICVCDTGSTDNTIDVVKNFFKDNKIPHRIAKHKWLNFGHNRTLSFEETASFCKELKWNPEKTYAFMLDADMELIYDESFNRETMHENSYNLLLKTSYNKYHLPLFLKISRKWKSTGATHEYWDDMMGDFDPVDLDEDEIYIEDIGDGGCKSDKYERDIKLLTDELKNDISKRLNIKYTEIDETILIKNVEETNSRTLYYLGQSYFDSKKYDDAIKWFEKRLEFKDNPDEEYQAYLKIALSKKELNSLDMRESFMKCIELYPFMLEPVYYLMKHYMDLENWKEAFEIGRFGLDIQYTDHFITDYQVYDYQYKDDMLIVCLENKKYGTGVKLGLSLLKERKFNREDKDRIKDNYKLCLDYLLDSELTELYDNRLHILVLGSTVSEKSIKLVNYLNSLNVVDSVNIINKFNILLISEETSNPPENWCNLSDNNISLLDKATYIAYKNKYKHVWIINENLEYNKIEFLNKLFMVKSNEDLITTKLSELCTEDEIETTEEELKAIKKITYDSENWMSTINDICRVSYKVLNKLNEFSKKNKKLCNNEFMFSTICNLFNYKIKYLDEFEQFELLTHYRKELIMKNSDLKKFKNQIDFLYISVYCIHQRLSNDILEYYIVDKDSKKLLNSVNILIDSNIKLSKSDNIMINALRNKNINIDIDVLDNKNLDTYNLVYKIDSFTCISSLLRDILNRIYDSKERLLFLENLLKNEEIVILSAGPSTGNLTDTELNYISENYLTICIKYVLETLLVKNIKPTFFIYNSWLNKNNTDYYSKLSKDLVTIFGEDGEDDETITVEPLINILLDDDNTHLDNFKLLEKNIDLITWTNDKNDNKTCKYMHIMCELALPLCIHLGISKIYTCGWDLKAINNKTYCNENIIDKIGSYDEKNKKETNPTEYEYVPNIKKILNDKGIEIYKIKESPILLEYKNIIN